MLVLSRKTRQEVYISDNVRIVVLGIFRGKVKLGIEAPKEVPVRRDNIKDTKEGQICQNKH